MYNSQLTEEQIKEFERISKEMMKFLCENLHPHTTVIINSTHAELSEGICAINTDEFVLD